MSKLEQGKTDYLDIEHKIDVLTDALKINLELLRNEVVPVLEQEWNTENFETPAELLREYIQITRRIRDLMFKRLDTHILTIEHLADKILCRRAAIERSKKTAVKKAIANSHEDTKVASNIVDSVKNMSPEERAKILAVLQGG